MGAPRDLELRLLGAALQYAARRIRANISVEVVGGELWVWFKRRLLIVKSWRRRHPWPPSMLVRRVAARLRGAREASGAARTTMALAVNRLTVGARLAAARLARAGRAVVVEGGASSLWHAVWAVLGSLAAEADESGRVSSAVFYARLQFAFERAARSLYGVDPSRGE